ncbi:MAG: NADH dehydrogenase [Roseovarius sp. BRH_c41]|nr:NADH dehydrogenase subunit C [Roseovarius sp. 217]KJS42148.1 MAG: NADH dehydrogenase [Roseovarius sp. BRH_c41]
MGGGGLIFMLIFAVLIVIPFWKLLPKFGIPNWVSLVAIIPLGALVLLWIMAFRDQFDGGRG